jgi:lactate permease
MTWQQNYDPLGNAALSTLVAALPVVALLGSIAAFKIRIHLAALLGLVVALAVAVFAFGMPGKLAAATTIFGAAYGLFPIGWIILNLIFLYQLTVEKGRFTVLRASLAALAPDPRIQVILIAFSLGAFFEGAAGFGTPVAVTAAILIQLGFRPLAASGLSLIANTAPVAFGALGTPIIALSKTTGIPETALSAMVGRQLPFFSLIIPFWVVWALAGFRGMIEIWPAALTAGLAFAVPQFLISNFHGPWLVDIVASISSMAAVAALLRFWRPKKIWKFPDATEKDPEVPQPIPLACKPGLARGAHAPSRAVFGAPAEHLHPLTSAAASATEANKVPDRETRSPSPQGRGQGEGKGHVKSANAPSSPDLVPVPPSTITPTSINSLQILRAWTPWLLLSVCIFCWGVPRTKTFLDGLSAPKFQVPALHNAIVRVPPVVPAPAPDHPTKPEEAVFNFNWLSATGTGILAAAILAGFVMGFSLREMAGIYWRTLVHVRFSLITIAAMLALGYVTRYSGADATLGLALARTGRLYPFFGTLLGWLGVALTGSDTASNVLFGSLQKITAEQTGIPATLMAAANSSGGVMGKMVDAQSIVVASAATNWYGREGSILRYVFFHSLALAVLMGLLVFLQAYVFPFNQMVVK